MKKLECRAALKTFCCQHGLAVVILVYIAACAACYDGRKAGHQQASGAAAVRTLIVSEFQYKSSYGQYTAELKALGGNAAECEKPSRTHACLVDAAVTNSSASNPKAAYYFTVQAGPDAETVVIWGIPIEPDYRVFCATEDGSVRMSAVGSNISSTSYAACKLLAPIGN